MHLPPWFWFSALVLITWGIVGLLQKLSTNEISAESALIWLVAGFILLTPVFLSGQSDVQLFEPQPHLRLDERRVECNWRMGAVGSNE